MEKSKNRWSRAPEGSNWGEFGPDDQLGRMNYVNQAKVLQGIQEVKVGKTFCLSLPLNLPGGSVLNPRRSPPEFFSVVARDEEGVHQTYCSPLPGASCHATDRVCDDIVLLSLQYSTQWDALAHMGSKFDTSGDGVSQTVFYNGYRADSDVIPGTHTESQKAATPFAHPKAQSLGIENLAAHGVQGRAVMLDLNRHFGNDRVAVGYDALMRILEEDKVEIEKGDMLCIYTGFADLVVEMNGHPDGETLSRSCAGLNGYDWKLLQWITDSGVACIISDNYAVEIVDHEREIPPGNPKMPLHEHCLFKNGIHLGELWYLRELALWLRWNGRSRFLLTAPPLRLPGAVGSPATPIATV